MSAHWAEPAGAFAPLRQRLFAVLWCATLIGNIGSFIRDVANAWMVAELSPSPLAVALVQAAATLPVFLLAIPAGVLSDMLDRRRLLIAAQLGLALVSATLMALAWRSGLDVSVLIGLTLAGGIGTALIGPAWLAIVPELIGKPLLREAMALNSLGVNIARAIGPAAGGLLLVSLGPTWTYGINVLGFIVVIGALWWWPRPKAQADELAERFMGAFRAGWRYACASDELRRVLLRTAFFFAFASAAWALLPLVAQRVLGGTAGLYGGLLGMIGAGAIAGAIGLPRLRRSLGADALVLLAALCVSSVMACLALKPPTALALTIMPILGLGWIVALTSFNGVTQVVLPNWVRGRGLAIYLAVFSGAMTAGSLVWGAMAQRLGVPPTLLIAALFFTLSALLLKQLPLPSGDADLSAAMQWPEPEHGDHRRGPVLVQIEYRVRRDDRPAFLNELRGLSKARRRDGADLWGVAEHAADPERIVEWFMVESWGEHLRQHRRVSQADAEIQRLVTRFHIGSESPQANHFISLM